MVTAMNKEDARQYQRSRYGRNVVHRVNVEIGWTNPTWTAAAATRELLQNVLDAVRDVALEIGCIQRIEWQHMPTSTATEERRILAIGIPFAPADAAAAAATDTDTAAAADQPLVSPTTPPVLLASITWERVVSASDAALCPAAHGGGESFVASTCTCKWRLVLENEAVRLCDRIMCVGGTSKKHQPRREALAAFGQIDGPIGHFGEGLKMALLVLCANEGVSVRMCTNDLWWSFHLDRHDELCQEKVLKTNRSAKAYMQHYVDTSLPDDDHVPSIAKIRPRRDCLRVVVDQLRARDVSWEHFLDLHPPPSAPKLLIHRHSRLDGAELLLAGTPPGACFHRGIWVETVDYLSFGINLLAEVRLNRDRERLPREFDNASSFLRTTLGRLCDLSDFHVTAHDTDKTLAEVLYDAFLGDEHSLLPQAARQHPAYCDNDGTKLSALAHLLWNEAVKRSGGHAAGRVFPLLAANAEDGTYTRDGSLRLLHEARLYDPAQPWQEQCLDVSPLLYHMCATSSILADLHAASAAFRDEMFRDAPPMSITRAVASALTHIDAELSRALGQTIHVIVHDVAPLRANEIGRARLHDENLSLMRVEEKKEEEEAHADPSSRCCTISLHVLSPLVFEREWFHRVHGQNCAGDAALPCKCVVIFLTNFLVAHLGLSWSDVAKRTIHNISPPACTCGTNDRHRAIIDAPPAVTIEDVTDDDDNINDDGGFAPYTEDATMAASRMDSDAAAARVLNAIGRQQASVREVAAAAAEAAAPAESPSVQSPHNNHRKRSSEAAAASAANPVPQDHDEAKGPTPKRARREQELPEPCHTSRMHMVSCDDCRHFLTL
jgi:hypothetical protein